MASLLISAKRDFYGACSPPAMTIFRDANGNAIIALPETKGDSVSWTVPDTPGNRALFRSDYEPSGKFSCKSIDMETPKAFEALPLTISGAGAAKAAAKTAAKK